MLQFTVANWYDFVFQITRVVNKGGLDKHRIYGFNNGIYPIVITLLFFLDTLLFLFGYLFETSLFNNKVRSVDS